MSVSLYLGLPGDGKSMSGMRRLETVLTTTQNWVVTNLPVEIGELQFYLRERYGGRDFDCARRVVLLEQRQVRKFWLIRGDGWRLVDIEDSAWAQNQFPSLQKVYRYKPDTSGRDVRRTPIEELTPAGVARLVEAGEVEEGDLGALELGSDYEIDEAQNFWPARSFQTTPRGLLFYMSQHRHVGGKVTNDNLTFITQKESQLEKVIRSLVMEFWVFRNMGQRRRLGFRLPGLFGYACYNDPPSSVGAQYQGIGTFRMDVEGLAKCYRTADGVGVGGPTMAGDAGKKKPGRSWVWAVVIFLVLLAAAIAAPGVITKLVATVLGRSTKVAAVKATNAVAGVQAVPRANVPVRARRERGGPEDPKPGDVYLAGALRGKLGWTVTLTDGSDWGPEQIVRAREAGGNLLSVQLEDGRVISWGGRVGRTNAPAGVLLGDHEKRIAIPGRMRRVQ